VGHAYGWVGRGAHPNTMGSQFRATGQNLLQRLGTAKGDLRPVHPRQRMAAAHSLDGCSAPA